jgi:hypothetical protein
MQPLMGVLSVQIGRGGWLCGKKLGMNMTSVWMPSLKLWTFKVCAAEVMSYGPIPVQNFSWTV